MVIGKISGIIDKAVYPGVVHLSKNNDEESRSMHRIRKSKHTNTKAFFARRLKILGALLIALIFQLIPRLALAAGTAEKAELLERKVPLEGLSGISLFFAKTYNENLWLYAIYCTVLMAVVGMVIALVTDIILKAMGMEVDKIEHHE